MSDTSDDTPGPASEISLIEALAEAEREAAEPAPGFSNGSELAPSPAGAYGGEPVIQFSLGEIRAAVPLVRAVEIGRHPRITPLPNLPGWLLGVSNVRGDIVSMVDLAAFLGMDRPRSGRRRRFIVVRDRDMRVGLVVDWIVGIRTLEAPGDSGDSREETWHRFVAEERVLPDGVLHLIDLDSLLSDPAMTAFRPE